MLEIPWSSEITKDPLVLADAIELAVAFDEARFGRFTQAEFQNVVDTENFQDDDQSYFTEDQVDERNTQFEDVLDLIRKRAKWLGSAYPFCVVTNEVGFKPQHTLRRYLPYLFLLVCANGNSVPTLSNALPDQFELLCKEALRTLFPDWAQVLSFGQRTEDRKRIFGYSAQKAVPKVAKMLNAELLRSNQIPNTQLEFGIDIIAICPFDDQSGHPFFAFAQCTLSQDWWNKRHEASADYALEAYVHMETKHSNFLMIPHFPRYNLNNWSVDHSKTINCILCDRLRICKLLDRSGFYRQDGFPDGIAKIFSKLEESLDSTHDPLSSLQ